jgi:hypothetical protein
MLQFLNQIIAKIIAIVAGLIIAVGIVQVPASPAGGPPIPEYEIPPHKIPEVKEITKETAPAPLPKPANETKKSPAPISPSSQTPEQTPALAPAISLIELNAKTRKTIVNIICTTQAGGSLNPITGSGVIVSPKGVILTNAHIGQYFLLENIPEAGYLNCLIRNGDIAQPAYDAKLIYIPSAWIEENAPNIIQQEAKGTGENDYAFLLIDKSIVEGKELPQIFDFTEPNLNFNILPINFQVFLGSYPAGFLGGIAIQKDLGLTSTFAPVTNLYTFATSGPAFLDVFSLGGNIASQGGSSGGAAVDTRDGKLLGIITTSSEATTTGARILNAITIPHIKRSFEKYTGQPLSYFLDTPEDYNLLFGTEFNRLKGLLIEQLNKR